MKTVVVGMGAFFWKWVCPLIILSWLFCRPSGQIRYKRLTKNIWVACYVIKGRRWKIF
jgi:hypothetical protein